MLRRRAALAALSASVLAACGGPGVAGGAGAASSAQPTGSATPTSAPPTSAPPTADTAAPTHAASSPGAASCTEEAAALSLEKQVGQLFMVGVTPGQGTQRVVAAGVGSIILLGTWTGGRAATAAQVEAFTRAVPGLLVATDQEGGVVQRLKGTGFDTIPNAPAQAALGDEALGQAADRWATQLWAAGVRYKLTTNQPIGVLKRGYGSDAATVGARVAAFVTGMERASVATSLKHFPGLGEVTGNTDFTSATDSVTTRTSASIASFRAGIAAGASSVMVSSAVYSKIDPGVPAVFSKLIVTEMLRGDLGFTGVAISDDLGAAESVSGVSPGDRAVRFFAAGGDLLINADVTLQAAMTELPSASWLTLRTA